MFTSDSNLHFLLNLNFDQILIIFIEIPLRWCMAAKLKNFDWKKSMDFIVYGIQYITLVLTWKLYQ